MLFKIEYEDDKGIWHDVFGDDGKLLTFDKEDAARAALAQRYPILFQMEKYGSGKRTRVIRILEDEDDWPKGEEIAMIDFYTADSSNGQRVAIMLEECGLPYKLVKLDLMGGEQRKPEFLKVNPAGAIPAIVDPDGPGGKPLSLAQSAAIVLYLAEKTRHFLPQDPARRAEALQWLMQAMTDTAASSMAIFLLSNFVPEKAAANVAYFEERVVRFFRLADQRLADRPYLAQELSVADFALYPLAVVRRPLIERAGDLPHLTRWAADLAARPGVERGMKAAK